MYGESSSLIQRPVRVSNPESLTQKKIDLLLRQIAPQTVSKIDNCKTLSFTQAFIDGHTVWLGGVLVDITKESTALSQPVTARNIYMTPTY